jgi:hypothetical protein
VQNPQSDACFRLARSWLSTCLNSHDRCNKLSRNKLPTRLINVGSAGSSQIPNLHITGPSDAVVAYATLSHCWGSNTSRISMLKSNNTLMMMKGIDTSTLSKTFQDAIIITRGLGIKFLWIDALCIIQDQKEDWALESTKMGLYYKGGTVMISALASPSADNGILNMRDVDLGSAKVYVDGTETFIRPVLEDAVSVLNSPSRYSEARQPISIQPLNGRAWTLQERLFAPRILHYTSQQMIWHCKTCIFSEDNQFDVDDEPRLRGFLTDFDNQYCSNTKGRLTDKGKTEMDEVPKPRTSVRRTGWYGLVTAFTSRDITYDSDLLPGLSGLAREIQEWTGARYLAGIWNAHPSTFIRSLLWNVVDNNNSSRDKPASKSHNGCPSWSWASINGSIEYDHQESVLSQQAAIDPGFFLKEAQLKTSNPFGQVRNGVLGLMGTYHAYTGPTTFIEFHTQKRMEKWEINDEDPSFDKKDCSYEGIYNTGLDGNSEKIGSEIEEDGLYVSLDIANPDYDWLAHQHIILFMSLWDKDNDDTDGLGAHQEFLLLRRVEREDVEHIKSKDPKAAVYERVGMAQASWPDVLDVGKAEGWARRKIYLI